MNIKKNFNDNTTESKFRQKFKKRMSINNCKKQYFFKNTNELKRLYLNAYY